MGGGVVVTLMATVARVVSAGCSEPGWLANKLSRCPSLQHQRKIARRGFGFGCRHAATILTQHPSQSVNQSVPAGGQSTADRYVDMSSSSKKQEPKKAGLPCGVGVAVINIISVIR